MLTSEEDGTRRLADAELLTRSATLERAIVSHDKDFLIEARRRQREGVHFSGVCHAAEPAVVIGRLIADPELLASVLEPSEAANRVFFLPSWPRPRWAGGPEVGLPLEALLPQLGHQVVRPLRRPGVAFDGEG